MNKMNKIGNCKVVVKEGESLDSALKRFKRGLIKNDVLKDMRKKEFYISKSQARRLKSEAARKRQKKTQK